VEPQRLVGRAVRANDQGRRQIRSLKTPSPVRDHVAVTGEYNRRSVGTYTVTCRPSLVERLGNNLACDRHPSNVLSVHGDTPAAQLKVDPLNGLFFCVNLKGRVVAPRFGVKRYYSLASWNSA
jgi:hypothetical protein